MEVLGLELKTVGVEGKYFLVKMLHDTSWETSPDHSVRFLSNLFGMTARAVSVAIEELSANGYISARPVHSGARGKHKRTIALTWKNKSQKPAKDKTSKTAKRNNRNTPTPTDYHEPLISHLLERDVVKEVEICRKGGKGKAEAMGKKRHPLSYSGRLLLSTLLSYADRCGAVRSLSTADLARLTGMSPDRVNSHIHQFKCEGYIRSSYPGVSGSQLFSKSKGGFFLNLSHRRFMSEAKGGTAICLHSTMPVTNEAAWIADLASAFENYSQLHTLYDDVKAARRLAADEMRIESKNPMFAKARERSIGYLNTKRQSVEGFNFLVNTLAATGDHIPVTWKFAEIYPFFKDLKSVGIRQHLQIRLVELASVILTEHWVALERKAPIPRRAGDTLDTLLNRFPPQRMTNTDKAIAAPLARRVKWLKWFMLGTATIMARKYQAIIKSTDIPFLNMEFTILPKPPLSQQDNFSSGVTILCMPKNTRLMQYDVIVRMDRSPHNGETAIQPPCNEDRLTDTDRFKFGLLTKMGTQPNA
jgi:DNA-binding MarR family transcriptional regulator